MRCAVADDACQNVAISERYRVPELLICGYNNLVYDSEPTLEGAHDQYQDNVGLYDQIRNLARRTLAELELAWLVALSRLSKDFSSVASKH